MKSWIKQPNRYDILCGKGKECNGSEGSQRYRLVIDSFREKYASAATRHQKCAITLQIYDLLAKTASRFLKYNDKMGAWEELPFMTARDKIGHALRFANRKSSKKGSQMSAAAAAAAAADLELPMTCSSISPMTNGSMISTTSTSMIPLQGQNEPQGRRNTLDVTTLMSQARTLAAQRQARQITPRKTNGDAKKTDDSMQSQHHGHALGQLSLRNLLNGRTPSVNQIQPQQFLSQSLAGVAGLLQNDTNSKRVDGGGSSSSSCGKPQERSPMLAPVAPASATLEEEVTSTPPISTDQSNTTKKDDDRLEQARQYLRLAFNSQSSSSTSSKHDKNGSMAQKVPAVVGWSTGKPAQQGENRQSASSSLILDPQLHDADDDGNDSIGTIEGCDWEEEGLIMY